MANQIKKKSQLKSLTLTYCLSDPEAGHNMSNEDTMIPRLRILQDGSPQVKREMEHMLMVLDRTYL